MIEDTYLDIIPDEVAVRRRLDRLQAEQRLLRRQLKLSQEATDCCEEQDACTEGGGEGELGGEAASVGA